MIALPKTSEISLSPFEEERFGVRAARSVTVDAHDILAHLDYCRRHGVDMLIARCSVDAIDIAQAYQRLGASLCDGLIYFHRDLTRGSSQTALPVGVRKAEPSDADAVASVALAAFSAYRGHYHADRRLDAARANDAYADWARRTCLDPHAATAVLVAVEGARILGFVAMRAIDDEVVDVVLNAVAPDVQGRGIYTGLFGHAIAWAKASGYRRLVISTQLNNLAVQRVWIRTGLEPYLGLYTFHLWLRDGAAAFSEGA